MNKSFLLLIIFAETAMCGAVPDASPFMNFRFGGYACATNFFLDGSLLNASPPPAAFSKNLSYMQRLWSRVTKSSGENSLKNQLSFWQPRMMQRIFAMEKAFCKNDHTAFKEQCEKLKADFNVIAQDPNREIVFSSMFPVVIESFFRMQEGPLPQRGWLTPQILQDTLEYDALKKSGSVILKRLQTYVTLLGVANRIIGYRDKNGTLPVALSDILERTPLDAWGHPIVYLQQNQRWLLKSLSDDGTDDGYDFENNVPLIPGKRDLVLFDGMSQTRKRLLTDGQLQMSYIKVTLFKGSVRVDDFLSAPK